MLELVRFLEYNFEQDSSPLLVRELVESIKKFYDVDVDPDVFKKLSDFGFVFVEVDMKQLNWQSTRFCNNENFLVFRNNIPKNETVNLYLYDYLKTGREVSKPKKLADIGMSGEEQMQIMMHYDNLVRAEFEENYKNQIQVYKKEIHYKDNRNKNLKEQNRRLEMQIQRHNHTVQNHHKNAQTDDNFFYMVVLLFYSFLASLSANIYMIL